MFSEHSGTKLEMKFKDKSLKINIHMSQYPMSQSSIQGLSQEKVRTYFSLSNYENVTFPNLCAIPKVDGV